MDKMQALEALIDLYTENENDLVMVWDDIVPGVKYDPYVLYKLKSFYNNSVPGEPFYIGMVSSIHNYSGEAVKVLNHLGFETTFATVGEPLFSPLFTANQNGYFAIREV